MLQLAHMLNDYIPAKQKYDKLLQVTLFFQRTLDRSTFTPNLGHRRACHCSLTRLSRDP